MVLTDLRMPRLNGLDLIMEVKARAPQATIVLMTAYGAIETAVEAMKLGASEYLLKPFSMREEGPSAMGLAAGSGTAGVNPPWAP